MKKLVCALLIIVCLASLLVACGEETFTCDFCQKEVTGKKHTIKVKDHEANYCDDCYEQMDKVKDEITDEIGDISDALGGLKDLG